MNINIKHIPTNELQLTFRGLAEQIDWNMARKNFALVLALQAGAKVIEEELDARYFPEPAYV